MVNKSFVIILVGLFSMIIASVIFYFESRSYIGYGLWGAGFLLVGVGILIGFFKMVSDDKN